MPARGLHGAVRRPCWTGTRFVVPRYRPDLSAGGALAMSYEPSTPIETLADAPPDPRPGDDGADRPVPAGDVRIPLMQTDPNFANYRWRAETGQIVLLDFGATREIDEDLAAGHLALLRAGLSRDRDAVLVALEAMSFVRTGLAERHRVALLDMAQMGFAALDGPLDFATDDLPDRMRRRGMEIGSERELWHIPPARSLFLQRKIGGLYLLAARLGAGWIFRRFWSAGPEPSPAGAS
jgi:hypothetical protein